MFDIHTAMLECRTHYRLVRAVSGVAWVLLVVWWDTFSRGNASKSLRTRLCLFPRLACNTMMMIAFIITLGDIMEQLHLELSRLFLPSFT